MTAPPTAEQIHADLVLSPQGMSVALIARRWQCAEHEIAKVVFDPAKYGRLFQQKPGGRRLTAVVPKTPVPTVDQIAHAMRSMPAELRHRGIGISRLAKHLDLRYAELSPVVYSTAEYWYHKPGSRTLWLWEDLGETDFSSKCEWPTDRLRNLYDAIPERFESLRGTVRAHLFAREVGGTP